ncbi:flagellar basal body P-ring formation chaperone FlgA [Phycisphaerales bacterium AB-hyl4]|uniref:Flagellar basal body P-ring formation chaperone FlgA n=1 Tax=Natronomicrosphaera hydrolytica TaxID=3242702 RepID=A0ABV4U5X6_9BACT
MMHDHAHNSNRPRPANQRIGYPHAITLIVTLLVAAPAFADAIRLQRAATVAGSDIRLADVAELTGDRAEALGDTVIASFGERSEITLRLADVRLALEEHDVHWGLVSLRGHADCLVRKSADRPSPGDREPRNDASAVASNVEDEINLDTSMTLAAQIIELLEHLTGASRDELRIDFRDRDADYLNRSAITYRFELESNSSTGVGRVPVAVRQYRGDTPVEEFNLSVNVERRMLALVAQYTIGRGDAFVDGSVRVREVYVSTDRGQPLDDRRLVEGQRAAAVLREGAVVYPEHVRSPVLVRRGELVTVRALVGGLMVRTVGRATEEGAEGEVIQIRNEGSRESFFATVTGRREVLISDEDNN